MPVGSLLPVTQGAAKRNGSDIVSLPFSCWMSYCCYEVLSLPSSKPLVVLVSLLVLVLQALVQLGGLVRE